MIVNLGVTTKRRNSTQRPTLGQSFNCTLKEGCSIMNPTIRIDRAAISGNNYNYAYIPDFARYYWITDIRYAGALVYIDMAVDVLATYKAAIGNKDLYIVRSSAESDGGITDNLYPTTSTMSMAEDSLESFRTYPISYVVGIIGIGAVQYLACNPLGFQLLCNFILSDDYASDYCGIFSAINPNVKAMLDPLQYIASVRAYPFDLSAGGSTGIALSVGPVQHVFTQGVFKYIDNPTGGVGISHAITFKPHPQTDDRGMWVNGRMCTDISLYTPLGCADLDGTIMAQAELLAGSLSVDAFTGDAVYTILASKGSTVNRLCRLAGNIGVDIPLTNVVSGGISLVQAAATAAAVAGSVATANPLAIATSSINAAGSITDGIYNIIPKAKQVSGQGTFNAWNAGIRLDYVWRHVSDDFNEDRGRPLCKVRKPKDIPGYIMASDPDVAISGTEAEASEVNSMLAAGIFYE